MYLLHCPRCWGVTLLADDEADVGCRWCRWRGRPPLENLVHDPQAVRRFVLAELQPVGQVLALFGVAQCVTAAIYFLLFFGCGGALARFGYTPQLVLVAAVGAVLAVGGVIIWAASFAVRTGRGRLIAVAGAVFALTSPLLLGIPIGVWAVRELTRPEVRAVFARPG